MDQPHEVVDEYDRASDAIGQHFPSQKHVWSSFHVLMDSAIHYTTIVRNHRYTFDYVQSNQRSIQIGYIGLRRQSRRLNQI